MKLYEIKEQFKGLQALVDSGELTKEDIADTLESLDASLEEKVKNCLMIRQHYLAESAALDAEASRLIALQVAADKKAESLLEYVKLNMLSIGKDKLDAGLFKLTLRKAVKKLGDIDEAKVPAEFFTVIPEVKKLDKRALLKAAKESDIEGVTVIDGERSLMVK